MGLSSLSVVFSQQLGWYIPPRSHYVGPGRTFPQAQGLGAVRLSLKLLFEDKTGWGSGVLRSEVSWERVVAENPAVERKCQGGFGGVPGGDGVQGTAEAEGEVIT